MQLASPGYHGGNADDPSSSYNPKEIDMIIGTILNCGDNASTQTYYTPWTNAVGNWAKMVLEVLNVAGADVKVTVQTKTEEEADSAAFDATREWPMSGAVSTVGLHPWDAGKTFTDGTTAGLLQLIRFKIEVGSTNGALGLINCRLLNPSWQTH